ncbi:uncharacterized protein LOC125056335 [Pieris napi]|uniref:HSF-type DNA-binding domain-containing protein n=1 Tax=Pieris macdunnoughi TaxID=345717 RepID=A0A821NJZ8_9NEOP|nr:uncharacterized protein LOC125056335 [Pieris napi]CAF4785587.1 unnamed protein product [Pieris macdunnoughi]
MQEVSSALRQMRFPQKLWYLLDLHTDAILWGGTGRTILLNYRVLHTYLRCNHSIFKTTNISSFVRQLNLYGFRKVTSHLQDPLCNSSNPYMHEYMHDYFQFDRPELLNKITRKALTMKKNFKVKNIFGNTDHLLNMTPLQKARRALQVALKKAVQNVYSQDSTKQFYQAEFDDEHEDFQEESFDVDWIPGESPFKSFENNIQQAAIEKSATSDEMETHTVMETIGVVPQESLMHFSEDSNKQTNDNYPTHFLNMPDLDSEQIEENSGVELLAEFNINSNMDQGIIKKKNLKDSSLNCVLPSVSNDDISFNESNDDINHYNGEWDQMFSDMMTNKSSSQDSVSNLKELYSQISQTIDLLNS